jgi:hypothetical protein
MGKKIVNSKKDKNEKSINVEDKNKDIESEDSGDRPLKVVQPFRHRREKNTDFLSRGQKKRLLKKAKMYNRSELIKKLEIKGLRNPVNTCNKEKIKKNVEEKQFLFNKIDDELMNLINSEMNAINNNNNNTNNNTNTNINNFKNSKVLKSNESENNNKSKITANKNNTYQTKNSNISNSRNKKHKLNKLIDEEKEKIISVLQNPVFQNNPIEAVRNHINQTQMINEKNLHSNKNFIKYMSMSEIKK